MTDILLTCPKCSTVLDQFVTAGVEVDRCPSCGGLWLDHGELARLQIRAGFLEREALQQPSANRRVPPSSFRVQLPCPACEGLLLPRAVEGVVIDVCEACDGIWLDRGELDVAIDALRHQDERE